MDYCTADYWLYVPKLVSQNNKTAAMLASQTNPVGVEFFGFLNALPCNQYAQQIGMWVKTKRLGPVYKEWGTPV